MAFFHCTMENLCKFYPKGIWKFNLGLTSSAFGGKHLRARCRSSWGDEGRWGVKDHSTVGEVREVTQPMPPLVSRDRETESVIEDLFKKSQCSPIPRSHLQSLRRQGIVEETPALESDSLNSNPNSTITSWVILDSLQPIPQFPHL